MYVCTYNINATSQPLAGTCTYRIEHILNDDIYKQNQLGLLTYISGQIRTQLACVSAPFTYWTNSCILCCQPPAACQPTRFGRPLWVNSCDRNTRERKRERERKGNIRFSYPSHDSTSDVSIVTVVLSSTKQSIPSSHHPNILIIPSSSHHFLQSPLPHLYSVLPDGISDSLPFGKAKRVEKEKIDITMHRYHFFFPLRGSRHELTNYPLTT